jgi:ATP-dependent protease ClpP protease subunit
VSEDDRQHLFLRRARWGQPHPPILAKSTAPKMNGKVAMMRLYAPIDPDGGEWGVSSKEFAEALDQVGEDTTEIQLAINSPGGAVFESIAMLNLLRRHPARVVVTVDGLAASGASVVAMAGDEIVMARNAEMMIHEAWGLVVGNSEDMGDMATRLEKDSANVASVYATHAGGTVDTWRQAMREETWYTAEEAVEAGLADRVEQKADATDAKAQVDVSVFNHAGRANAPAPRLPAKPSRHVARDVSAAQAAAQIHNAPVRGTTAPEEGEMQFTDEQLSELRTKLGISEDKELEPAMVLAALGEPAGTQPDSGEGAAPATQPQPEKPAQPKLAAGTVTVDQGAWDEREERIRRLEAEAAKRRREERDSVIAQAVNDGKFPPSRAETWQRLWDADPEGTRQVIDGLTRNVVPVMAMGYAGGPDDEGVDEEFAHLFPPTYASKGA